MNVLTFVPNAALDLSPADVRDAWEESLPYLMTYGERDGLTTYAPSAQFILCVSYITVPDPDVTYGVVTAHEVPAVWHERYPFRGASEFIDALRNARAVL